MAAALSPAEPPTRSVANSACSNTSVASMFNRLGPLKAVEQGHISMAHDASAKLNVPAFVNAKSLQGAVPQHAQGMEQQSKLASVTSEGSMFSRLYSRLSAAEPTPQTISEPAATSKSAAASAFHSRSPTPDPTEGDDMWYDFNADSDADMLEENEGVQPCAKMKSVSNNPGGRCTKANHQASLDRASILEDLKYEHPHGARGCGNSCEGLQCSNETQQRQFANAAEAERLCYFGKSKAQVLLDKLWEQPAHSAAEHEWYIGNRRLCHHCYCAASDLLQRPSRQRKSVHWETASAHLHLGKTIIANKTNTHRKKDTPISFKTDAAVGWLTQWCHKSMCNVQEKTDDYKKHVQGISRKDLLKMLLKEKGQDWISYRAFCHAARQMNNDPELPFIKFHKHKSQQECATCTGLKFLLRSAQKRGDAGATRHYEQKLLQHNTQARWERLAYAVRVAAGSAKKQAWSFGMDGYCSFKSSCFTIRGKPMRDMKGASGLNKAEQIKFKTTGVIAHGYGYYLYVADPTVSANANFNIDCLHRTLSKMFTDLQDPTNTELTEWPSEIYIQVDGGSDNKARSFFSYCDNLVKSGIVDVVYLSFLMVGHTHADYDQKFVPITFELRKGKVSSLKDLLKTYAKAYTDKDAQPKVIEHVTTVPDYFEWFKTGWSTFQGFARKVPDEDRPHQFVFEPNGMNYRNFSTDKNKWNTDPVNILPVGMADTPPMQAPQRAHLEKLANIRSNVFEHWNLNKMATQKGGDPLLTEEVTLTIIKFAAKQTLIMTLALDLRTDKTWRACSTNFAQKMGLCWI